MTPLVLATGNPDKLRELSPFFANLDLELVAVRALVPGWEVEETGATLEANATLKARAAVTATRLPAVADDTGLFVDALGGAPGVRSSRFAGEGATYADNVARLLAELEPVPAEERGARFRTVAALARPDGALERFEGVLEGRILRAPRGKGGFGYDPVFLVEERGRTLAELPLEEKNRISHRAGAFRAASAWLAERPGWLKSAGV
ncbi:MAG: RdgB/HAM1 family non-canonical purine NTP pyrophosphatase [Gemmatimonadetes bacterium]|nr:RdgB/HAM1 family non-canonical purine NTP pyrophosphatase [Gemmatimonadota bacterium]